MAIEIEEKLQVEAPLDVVWRFLLDPHRVVACMPGASLDEVVDERTFLGSVKVKLGAITASYGGRIEFAEVDEGAHALRLVAEGREKGGGTARGSMGCRLQELSDGHTELVTTARVDLTGRVMQMGRGMIKGISHQLFQQFASRAREQLLLAQAEASPAAAGGEEVQEISPKPAAREVPAGRDDAVSVIGLLVKALWEAVTRFVRRLFGGRAG